MNYTSPVQPENADKHRESSSKNPSKGGNNVIKIVVVAVGLFILLAGGIVALVFNILAGFMGASNDFMEALKNDNPAAAYEMASTGFQNEGTSDQFEDFFGSNDILSNIESYNLNSFHAENNYGTARGTITTKDGQVSPVLLELVLENGEWKVLGIDLNPAPEKADEYDYDDSATEFMDI